MFDAGKTDVRVLYELSVLLEYLPIACIDPRSKLFQTLQALTNSVYDQLPERVVIDFSQDD